MAEGEGKETSNTTGEFIHTGGWLFVHDNNSVEINLLECEDKEVFDWDKLDGCGESETNSAAGRVAANLQTKTIKLL